MVVVLWAAQRPFLVPSLFCAFSVLPFLFSFNSKSAFKMLSNFLDSELTRSRDVFPLPLLPVSSIQKQTLSRPVRQRLCKDICSTVRSNDAIACLNNIFCQPYDCESGVGSNSILCSEYVKQCMREYVPSCSVVPQEALLSLLGTDGHSTYSHDDELATSTLVAYQPGRTSLPCIMSPPHPVANMLDNEAAHYLVEFEKEMMMDPTTYHRVIQREGKYNRISIPF